MADVKREVCIENILIHHGRANEGSNENFIVHRLVM